jgi:hypothetical protein
VLVYFCSAIALLLIAFAPRASKIICTAIRDTMNVGYPEATSLLTVRLSAPVIQAVYAF